MSNLEIGLASFPALLILIFIRVPIGLAMFLVGLVGLYFVTGSFNLPLARLKSETFSTFSSYTLSICSNVFADGPFCNPWWDVDCAV
jgi:C4-dicarboxylate transporter DctM subunit